MLNIVANMMDKNGIALDEVCNFVILFFWEIEMWQESFHAILFICITVNNLESEAYCLLREEFVMWFC